MIKFREIIAQDQLLKLATYNNFKLPVPLFAAHTCIALVKLKYSLHNRLYCTPPPSVYVRRGKEPATVWCETNYSNGGPLLASPVTTFTTIQYRRHMLIKRLRYRLTDFYSSCFTFYIYFIFLICIFFWDFFWDSIRIFPSQRKQACQNFAEKFKKLEFWQLPEVLHLWFRVGEGWGIFYQGMRHFSQDFRDKLTPQWKT